MRQLVSVDAVSRHPIERIRHDSLLYPELPNGKTHDKIKPKFNQIEELPIQQKHYSFPVYLGYIRI